MAVGWLERCANRDDKRIVRTGQQLDYLCRAACTVRAFSLETGSSEISDLRSLIRELVIGTTIFVCSRTRSLPKIRLKNRQFGLVSRVLDVAQRIRNTGS